MPYWTLLFFFSFKILVAIILIKDNIQRINKWKIINSLTFSPKLNYCKYLLIRWNIGNSSSSIRKNINNQVLWSRSLLLKSPQLIKLKKIIFHTKIKQHQVTTKDLFLQKNVSICTVAWILFYRKLAIEIYKPKTKNKNILYKYKFV